MALLLISQLLAWLKNVLAVVGPPIPTFQVLLVEVAVRGTRQRMDESPALVDSLHPHILLGYIRLSSVNNDFHRRLQLNFPPVNGFQP